METERPYSLGDALEHAYETALEDWRKMHGQHISPEELFAEAIASVNQQTVFWNAGRANTTISVIARKKHQAEVFFFLLQKRQNQWYFQDRA